MTNEAWDRKELQIRRAVALADALISRDVAGGVYWDVRIWLAVFHAAMNSCYYNLMANATTAAEIVASSS